jgi:predicted GNAT family N-acyltransferase
MSYSISLVPWEQAAPLLKSVREKVSICERRTPRKVEFDNKDKEAVHILVCDDDTHEPIATGRILPNGEISRISVLKPYRSVELVKRVMAVLLKTAVDLKLDKVYMYSSLSSIPFFSKYHFKAVGSVFMKSGIPKQCISCPIDSIKHAHYQLTH